MEKTINIDGRKVTFQSTGATPLRYKKQFGQDFFTDLMKMQGLSKIKSKNPTYEQIKQLDMEVFYNVAWVLAKTADSSIPEPMDWLDTFEVFPLMEIMPELQDLMLSSMQTSKKK
ncbi:hypothetical protein HMI01_10820 [Halolactibacillus miurensis]|uniref:Prophage pi2 protein 40 n=1 Tax=Halolactibacillus miurensis TaxID=306541 RepID=A0A1I6SHU1_9BACI|nr:hypothetical protein [Halolactibacillus miurensis]GEM04094.1 hypothetical protein HMI01_10820 [Halolactibacillus miurensis]SFS76479.1 hypothetical protein SAMN05421668_10960 [Halolactibacillus miurensis]